MSLSSKTLGLPMDRCELGQSRRERMRQFLIIDAHRVYRTELRNALAKKRPEVSVCEADGLVEGLAKIRFTDHFDLILVDFDLSSFPSLELLKGAFKTHLKTRFAIISGSDSRESILASLAAGFHGFISKRQYDCDILDAIDDIASGRIYVPPSLATIESPDLAYLNEEEGLPESEVHILRLTPRQREVLSHLALGMSNKEIGRALHITEATTKVHAAGLLRALGARNRTEAAFKAGRLLECLDRSPPVSSNSTQTVVVRDDKHMLKVLLLDAKTTVENTTSRLRRKAF